MKANQALRVGTAEAEIGSPGVTLTYTFEANTEEES